MKVIVTILFIWMMVSGVLWINTIHHMNDTDRSITVILEELDMLYVNIVDLRYDIHDFLYWMSGYDDVQLFQNNTIVNVNEDAEEWFVEIE